MCGQGHRSLPPPPASGAIARFQPGDRVAVLWGERWWGAHIVEVVSENSRKVHYEGWAPEFDAVVEVRSIRAIDYEPRTSIIPPFDDFGIKGKRSDMRSALGIALALVVIGGAIAIWINGDPGVSPNLNSSAVGTASVGGVFDQMPGEALPSDASVQRGAVYYVKWRDGWYQATVLELINPNEFLVQYDGWSVDYNEVVSRDRLRALR
jgi:hypothetical protein